MSIEIEVVVTGPPGPVGPHPTLTVGDVITGTPDAEFVDDGQDGYELNLTLPPGPELSIGTVDTGATADAEVTGNPYDGYVLDLTLPPVGANGVDAAAIQDDAVTSDKIANGTILNEDINADADIDRSKIAGTALTAESTGVFSVLDYGADPTGAADSTEAIQAAVDAAVAANGTVIIPLGNWSISDTLTITGTTTVGRGIAIRGAGMYGSNIVWTGAAGGIMMRWIGAYDGAVTDLTLDCQHLARGVVLNAGPSNTPVMTGWTGHRLRIRFPTVGLDVNPDASGDGVEEQVDSWELSDSLIVSNSSSTGDPSVMTAGVRIDTQNSTGRISNCRITGVADTGACIAIIKSLYLTVTGTNGAAQTDSEVDGAFVRITGSQGTLHLESCQAEKVSHFLHRLAPAASNYQPITLTACVINDPVTLAVRSRLTTVACQWSGSAGATYPLLVTTDHRNVWTDVGSYWAGSFANFISLGATLDVINIVGSTTDGTTDMTPTARMNYVGLEKTVWGRGNHEFAEGTAAAATMKFGTSYGMKIGSGATQKIGFWNATPVVQPSANADTSGASLGDLEIEVNQLKALLRSIGLMAS